jgi:hypothetical protein
MYLLVSFFDWRIELCEMLEGLSLFDKSFVPKSWEVFTAVSAVRFILMSGDRFRGLPCRCNLL